jgi:hypothetical protein
VIFYHFSSCVSSSIWTIHWTTNGLIWRFHLEMSTLSYSFPTCFSTEHLKPIMPKFYHVLAYGTQLAYNLTIFPNFSIIFSSFLHYFSYAIWSTPSFNYRHFVMCMHTSHQPYGYAFLMLCSWQQTHRNPWCNSQHFCHHCARCLLSCGMRTIACTSFNHIQLLLLISRHCAYQR